MQFSQYWKTLNLSSERSDPFAFEDEFAFQMMFTTCYS